LPVLRLQLVIIEDAFVCYQTRKSVLYLLCVISAIVPINFLVKSGESAFIVATCRDKTGDNTLLVLKLRCNKRSAYIERPTPPTSKRRPPFETRTCLGETNNLGPGSRGD
jgi:hypothetical protein